jgi:hypothetical protein
LRSGVGKQASNAVAEHRLAEHGFGLRWVLYGWLVAVGLMKEW